MNDEELKALEDKWTARLKTGIYTERSWLAECVGDLVTVIEAYQKYRKDTYIESSGEFYRYGVAEPVTLEEWERIDDFTFRRYSPNGAWEWQMVRSHHNGKWYWRVLDRQADTVKYSSAMGYSTPEQAAKNYAPTWEGKDDA